MEKSVPPLPTVGNSVMFEWLFKALSGHPDPTGYVPIGGTIVPVH